MDKILSLWQLHKSEALGYHNGSLIWLIYDHNWGLQCSRNHAKQQPLYVIDKSAQVAENPNYILTKQDILDFEAEHSHMAMLYITASG